MINNHATPSSEMHVYAIDDQPEYLHLLEKMLNTAGYSPHCFSRAEEFLAIAHESMTGCIITDLHLNGMDGDQLLLYVQKHIPALAVVVISGSAKISEAVSVVKHGALNFLEKPFTSQELIDAISDAFKKSQILRIDAEHTKNIRMRLLSLTKEELEVMKLMRRGTSNKSAAFQADLSERTLVRRRSSVFHKMGVSSVVQLIDLLKDYRDQDNLL